MHYRAIITPSSYIMHFNKNHDPSSGRFTFGDGDGDGVINDLARKSGMSEKDIKEVKEFRKTLGSKATQNQYDRAARSETDREFKKELAKFEKMSKQDEKTAYEMGDIDAAKLIASGRMYLNASSKEEYQYDLLNKAIAKIIKENGNLVTKGKDFTYKIDRDEKYGGLLVSIDDYQVHLSDSNFQREYDRMFREAVDTAVRNHQDMVNQEFINNGQRFMDEMNRQQIQQMLF